MMRRFIVVSGFLALFFISAADPVQARQPLTTYDAQPVPVHRIQFESGIHYLNYPGGDEAYHLEMELNYGLIDNLDLGVEIPFISWDPDRGEGADVVGDVIVKSKLLFLKGREGDPISLSFQPFVKLPTADEKYPLSTGESDLGFVLIGTRNLHPVMAHLNVGYTLVNGTTPQGDEYDNVFGFKIALEYLADPRYQVVGELAGETNRTPDADDYFSLLVGGRYLWMKDVTLDAGVALGLSDASPDFRSMLGVTTRF
ncbi:MAG: transporter [Nitrospirae bacterium]|nr:transporter [Nitrospirota bacterium]